MGLTERQETTDYAVRMISKFLNDDDPISAVLLTHIYSNIRLRSVIADHLRGKDTGVAWKRIQDFLRVPSFSLLLRYARRHKLLVKDYLGVLDNLNSRRNFIAHESKIWRKLTPEDEEDLIAAVQTSVQFLRETS